MNRTHRPFQLVGLAILATGAMALSADRAAAQSIANQLPPELNDVGVDEKRGDLLPMDLEFTDEQGRTVRLGDYFQSGRPVILTPVFYDCPMLCTLVLNGLVDGMKKLDWSAGEDFEIVTFSFKAGEPAPLAEVKKRAYLSQYRRDSAKNGWHFLVGSEASINELTEAIGFRFNPLPDGAIAHTATILFITPDGRVSRYMNDVMFKPRDLELALVEAGEGKLGSPLDKFALFMCFQYDPDKNSYTWAAWKVMRLGGALTMTMLAGTVFILWRRGARDPRAEIPAESLALSDPSNDPPDDPSNLGSSS